MKRPLTPQASCTYFLVALFAAAIPASVHVAASGHPPARQAPMEPGDDGRFSRQILWTRTWDGHRTALFLPEEVLRDTPLDSLPIGEGDRQALWNQLGGYEEYRKMLFELKGIELQGGCATPPERQYVPHEPTTLAKELVEYSVFGFTGEAVEVVTGWDTRRRRVAEVLYVRVDSILHDPEYRLVEGEVLRFIQYTGQMRIGDRTLCTKPSSNFYLAREHDQLLLGGDTYSRDGQLLYATLRLPVRNGVIQPFRMPTLLPMQPTPIHELEEQIDALQEEAQ